MWWYPVAGVLLFIFLMRFWSKRRMAKPPAPPFEVAPDDPLLVDAIRKARETLDRFRELHAQRPKDSYVKISGKSTAGRTEHLWGQLLEMTDDSMRLKPVNLHAAYNGPLEGDIVRPLGDLEDWQVELPDGNILGGFTLKVMFVRALEQCKDFPEELRSQQDRYLDH
jgi:uncharacterized protein YegJ (DUF2314 family)